AKRARIGYLPQVPVDREGLTVYEVLSLGYRDLLACREQMLQLEAEMAALEHSAGSREMEKLLKTYAEQQERFHRDGGYEMDANIQQVAQGLRIPAEQFARAYATLSGGEKTKVGLASLLIERPTILLLDEPTNHLDTAGVEWLETFLSTYAGTCLIVSHDRYFLDRVVTRVVELEDGEAEIYHSNYSGYVREKEERLLQQFSDFQEQQKRIKKMEETIRQLQEWGKIGGNNKFFRRAASMQKALDRMERVKRPVLDRRAADFDLQERDRSGREVVKIAGLRKQYGNRVLLNEIDAALLYGEKAVLMGPNGTGKSTLFKLLLGQTQPDGGTAELGARVEIGYLAQEDQPNSAKTVLQLFCEEASLETGEGRARLARYLFYGEDVFKAVSNLSGGEWTRLRLALLMHRKPNLLLLDEPTNHLDIASREALEEALEEFPGTVLAISHDRYFVNRIAQRIWELEDGCLTAYLGNYDDYRETRERLRLAQAQKPAVTAAAPVKARPARAPAGGGGAAKRAKALAEQAIADAEQRLAALEIALEQAQAATDVERLATLWSERETVRANLDELYERWLELEDED
ncbi:MAG TPA: ABC-F family ATP-binding cassette domain-containing protein, partial [Symbiobacteriaceae bacterium]|nr:ABC-F family ATP-binding cassette domain-containing protein [Symbiobacteriaceae bacterium]